MTRRLTEKHDQCVAVAGAIEGMLSSFSIANIDTLLSFQSAKGIVGHLVEMGVYRGKSAAVLAVYQGTDERLILIDITDNLDRTHLFEATSRAEFYLGDTRNTPTLVDDHDGLLGKCRCIHIDASHQFDSTMQELAIADALLGPDGFIMCDDFAHLDYAQNAAAIYKYLYTSGTNLTPFIITAEKAYLCRRDAFKLYGEMVLYGMTDQLSLRGVDAAIARTDRCDDFAAFHLRHRQVGEGAKANYEMYHGYFTEA